MDAEQRRCYTYIEDKEKARGETSGRELEGVRREGLSLVEICVTFSCARSRGEEAGEQTEGGRQRTGEPGERMQNLESTSRVQFP